MTCALVMLTLTEFCMWSMTKNRALLRLLREKDKLLDACIYRQQGDRLAAYNGDMFTVIATETIDGCRERGMRSGDELTVELKDHISPSPMLASALQKAVYDALGLNIEITIKQVSKDEN